MAGSTANMGVVVVMNVRARQERIVKKKNNSEKEERERDYN